MDNFGVGSEGTLASHANMMVLINLVALSWVSSITCTFTGHCIVSTNTS